MAAGKASGARADVIVRARAIHTMDRRRPRVEALAVVDGRVVAMGTWRQMAAWRGRRTVVVESAGEAVPGFHDCHTHFYHWATRLHQPDLGGARSLDEALSMVRAGVGRVGRGPWVVARRFDLGRREEVGDGRPCDVLDRAVGDRPAVVFARDGHSAWVNSRGLSSAGIPARTSTPAWWVMSREDGRTPKGVF